MLSCELSKRDGTGTLAYPLAYVYMMEPLDQSAYEKVFEHLNKIVGAPLQMQKVHLDFEQASSAALKASDENFDIARLYRIFYIVTSFYSIFIH